MTLNINNIKYDLYDPETNPNDDIDPADLSLPSKLVIEQSVIEELYGNDFDVERDMAELIACHTGFDPSDYKFTISE